MEQSSLRKQSAAIVTNQRTGEVRPFGVLWESKPVVLLFFRRLGCAICRAQAKEMNERRKELEDLGVNVVALSFENFGEGSDVDRSFEKGNYWSGEIQSIHKTVYSELFIRKGFLNGFQGLMEINKDVMDKVKAQGVTGNQKGDGFQLGGQFVVSTTGEIIFQHLQKKQGDDAEFDAIKEAVQKEVSPRT